MLARGKGTTMKETQSIVLKDGRELAYQCYGQTGGRPLYFFHGFPGCRLQASLVGHLSVLVNRFGDCLRDLPHIESRNLAFQVRNALS